MPAKTVGFAISEQDRPQLDLLVEHFGHGNRSEFLRAAMKRMRHEMWSEKMRGLQAQARQDLGCRVVTREEVNALVKKTLRASA